MLDFTPGFHRRLFTLSRIRRSFVMHVNVLSFSIAISNEATAPLKEHYMNNPQCKLGAAEHPTMSPALKELNIEIMENTFHRS